MFQPQFVELVKSGIKTQTIRKSARCKKGDLLSLRRWTGKAYRSKQEVILEAVCKWVLPVEITNSGIIVDGQQDVESDDELAKWDGFTDFADMRSWFERTHGLPFSGYVIEWEAK
jgi:hypothetical protein